MPIITSGKLLQASKIYEALRLTRPKTKAELKHYLKVFLNINVPNKKVCHNHDSPMDYLWYVFNADFLTKPKPNADCVVWANRSGGKTLLAAAATLLDCVFKEKCQVRILAGSGDQASRMYDYLVGFIGKGFEQLLNEPVRKSKCRFANGAVVELLTQSAASVRGQHIQKLRCDEIELFDQQVFEAAKFITQTKNNVTASMEILSTMHRPYGLMSKVVSNAEREGKKFFHWCVWEVIEKCRDRSCSRCRLERYCKGKAKKASGYFKIEDCITQMNRASRVSFESEMLCKRPNLDNAVFEDFDPDLNVKTLGFNRDLPLYRAIDFGFINPFVCLWLQTDDDGNVYVIDEYIQSKKTIEYHIKQMKKRYDISESEMAQTFCDPAGAGRNDVTGTSAVSVLRQNGIICRYKKSAIVQGIELLRSAICSGDNKRRFFVDPACVKVIEAMNCYHYSEKMPSELPVKDGIYDHPIDAIRYFLVNYKRWKKTGTIRSY